MDMLGFMPCLMQVFNESRRQLRIDEKAQSRGSDDAVIAGAGSISERCGDVFVGKIGEVCENLHPTCAVGKHVEYVGDTQPRALYPGSSTANARIAGDTRQNRVVHSLCAPITAIGLG